MWLGRPCPTHTALGTARKQQHLPGECWLSASGATSLGFSRTPLSGTCQALTPSKGARCGHSPSYCQCLNTLLLFPSIAPPTHPNLYPNAACPVSACPLSTLQRLAGQLHLIACHLPLPPPQPAAASVTLIIVNINHSPFTTVGRVIHPPLKPFNPLDFTSRVSPEPTSSSSSPLSFLTGIWPQALAPPIYPGHPRKASKQDLAPLLHEALS